MAYKNKIIRNPITGQDIKFLQVSKDTDGKLLEMESYYAPYSKEPVVHYHPYQEEYFTVLAGEISVRIHNKIKIFKEGETLHIPPNTSHSMWNHSDKKAIVNWKVQPALNTEQLLENMMGLSADGKVNESGMPAILQAILMINHYNKEYRLAKPSYIIQKILFAILTPFAFLTGYRPSYDKYTN